MNTPIIHVSLWGRKVGYLGYGENDTVATFEFDPTFASMALELSPIVMNSNKLLHKFDMISHRTFHGLPGIFADSLPDKFGNQLIDLFFANKGMLSDDITALDRLAYIGGRSMGAFEYFPEQSPGIAMGGGVLDIGYLSELANMILSNKAQFANELANASSHNDALSIIQIGSSAGGARSKALVARDETGALYDGSIDSGADKTYWLLKFDTDKNSDRDTKDPKGMTKIEYIYSLIAKECGITIPKTDYIINGNDFLFMTERFDREIHNGKLRKKHYSSWAALQHFDRDTTGSYSYEQLILTMRQLNLGHNEFVELYRRAVFNIIGRNQDDHTKNFGFQMDRNGQWGLSPAFDMTYTYDPLGKWTNTHQISLSGKRDHFDRHDLLSFASKCSINAKSANEIIDQILDGFSGFERLAKEFEVSSELYKQILSSLRVESLSLKNLMKP